MKFFWLSIPLLLASCGKTCLTVQTDYVTHKNLASYYVGTPDPRQNVAAVGQRLIICWAVPKNYLDYDDLRLEVTIRFRNREEVIEVFHIQKNRGTYVFSLLNNDYFTKRGILTYKVDLVGGNVILEEWRHKIWADLILLDQKQECQTGAQEPSEERQEQGNEEYPIDWNTEEL